MITDLPTDLKFETTDKNLSTNTGVLELVGLARRHGLLSFFSENLLTYQSNRAYDPEIYPCTQMMNRWTGGTTLEDGRYLAQDKSLHEILEVKGLPFPNTQSDYFNNARNLDAHRVRRKNRRLVWQILANKQARCLHIDVDAKVHASDNKKAEKTYKGYRGYHPIYVNIPNHKMCLDAIFRSGSASARSHLGSTVRMVLNEIPAWMEDVFFTLDSAGWQKKVCFKIDDVGFRFYIKVAEDPHHTKEKAIRKIDPERWRPVEPGPGEEPKDGEKRAEEREIAETQITLGSGKSQRIFRMVVVRKPRPSLNEKQRKALREMEDPSYSLFCHQRIGTNDTQMSADEVYHTYNSRGASEDVIGEIVEDGRADRFVCREDAGNALYLILNALTYNLMQETKDHATAVAEKVRRTQKEKGIKTKDQLPVEKWETFTPASLRRRIIHVATHITKHAHQRVVHISESFPWREVFEGVIFACWNPLAGKRDRKARAPT